MDVYFADPFLIVSTKRKKGRKERRKTKCGTKVYCEQVREKDLTATSFTFFTLLKTLVEHENRYKVLDIREIPRLNVRFFKYDQDGYLH